MKILLNKLILESFLENTKNNIANHYGKYLGSAGLAGGGVYYYDHPDVFSKHIDNIENKASKVMDALKDDTKVVSNIDSTTNPLEGNNRVITQLPQISQPILKDSDNPDIMNVLSQPLPIKSSIESGLSNVNDLLTTPLTSGITENTIPTSSTIGGTIPNKHNKRMQNVYGNLFGTKKQLNQGLKDSFNYNKNSIQNNARESLGI